MGRFKNRYKKVTFTTLRLNYQRGDKECNIYEDNIEFYPKRLKESKIIAEMFLRDIDDDDYYYCILDPVYGFELDNYDYYVVESGDEI